MIEIDLNKYEPCINDKSIADEIYNEILNANPLENEITLVMDQIISVGITPINIIFGGLYDYLGADKFHENLVLQGCSQILGDYITYILYERKKRNENSDIDSDEEK